MGGSYLQFLPKSSKIDMECKSLCSRCPKSYSLTFLAGCSNRMDKSEFSCAKDMRGCLKTIPVV